MPELEFYDRSFSPNIKSMISGDFVRYLGGFSMNYKGKPAPSLNGSKTALWAALKPSSSQDIPVLAVTVPLHEKNVDHYSHWYIGVTNTEELEKRITEIDSVRPKEAALAEAAISGPHDIYRALHLLIQLCPADYIK